MIRETLTNSRAMEFTAPEVNAVAVISKSTGAPSEGPAAAWAFDKSHRDPNGQTWKDLPITFAQTPHIIPRRRARSRSP